MPNPNGPEPTIKKEAGIKREVPTPPMEYGRSKTVNVPENFDEYGNDEYGGDEFEELGIFNGDATFDGLKPDEAVRTGPSAVRR